MGLAIRNVLARRTCQRKKEGCGPHSQKWHRTSDGGLCTCCRDGFPVGGDRGHAFVDCLARPFSFFLTLMRVGRGKEVGRR